MFYLFCRILVIKIVLFVLWLKKKKLPFPVNSLSKHACNLIHVDVWTPYSAPTSKVSNIFLTVVDEAIIVTWTFLMKSKSVFFLYNIEILL